jgi:3-phenylpropionate/trans-cinnamate dioxygenase ferredoxin reductase subunit
VIALGAVPCTDWLAGSGITAGDRLVCDATLTVLGAPDVLAAGDVASWPYGPAGDLLRVEHWTNAAEQGVLAGRNALVEPAERQAYAGIPSFWSDQYDAKVQAIGVSHLATSHHVVEASEAGDRLLGVGLRDGVLVSVAGFNAARRLPHYRARLGQPFDVHAEQRAVADDPKALGAPMAKLA